MNFNVIEREPGFQEMSLVRLHSIQEECESPSSDNAVMSPLEGIGYKGDKVGKEAIIRQNTSSKVRIHQIEEQPSFLVSGEEPESP